VNEDGNKTTKGNNDPRRRNKQVGKNCIPKFVPKIILATALFSHYNIQILT